MSQDIIDYWFKGTDFLKWWFRVDEKVDQHIKNKWYDTLVLASDEKLDSWVNDPEQLTALVIVLDQFSRNIRRIMKWNGSEQQEIDDIALSYAKLFFKNGFDKKVQSNIQSFA
jgi:uncharacterized protein (DUF924 family)